MDFISIEAIKYGKNGFMKESLAYSNYLVSTLKKTMVLF